MRPFLRGRFALIVATMTAGAIATGCGSSSPGESSGVSGSSTGASGSSSGASGSASGSGTSSGSSSGLSGSSTGSSSTGGDAGGCVFETLVKGLITNPPAAPVTCGSPLCGCTDDGMLITSVPGSF